METKKAVLMGRLFSCPLFEGRLCAKKKKTTNWLEKCGLNLIVSLPHFLTATAEGGAAVYAVIPWFGLETLEFLPAFKTFFEFVGNRLRTGSCSGDFVFVLLVEGGIGHGLLQLFEFAFQLLDPVRQFC